MEDPAHPPCGSERPALLRFSFLSLLFFPFPLSRQRFLHHFQEPPWSQCHMVSRVTGSSRSSSSETKWEITLDTFPSLVSPAAPPPPRRSGFASQPASPRSENPAVSDKLAQMNLSQGEIFLFPKISHRIARVDANLPGCCAAKDDQKQGAGCIRANLRAKGKIVMLMQPGNWPMGFEAGRGRRRGCCVCLGRIHHVRGFVIVPTSGSIRAVGRLR